MKQWKLIVVTLLAVLLVCACTSAMADECTHSWTTVHEVTEVSYKDVTENEHEKSWVKVEVCEKCETTKKTPMSEIQSHQYVETNTVVAPTCEDEGYTIWECFCGGTTKGTKKPATQHSPDWVYTDGTCVSVATNKYTCQKCGEVFETKEGGKGDHNYVKGEVVAPTCDEDGYTIYTCSYCKDEKHWDVKEAAHKWSYVNTVAPTCTEKGYNNYVCTACAETAKFDYKDAAHKTVKHDYKAPTCGAAGNETYYTCEGCDVIWNANWVVKSSIPTIEPDASLHEYNEYNGWKTVKAATCTKDGLAENACIHCGNKITKVIETEGHTYDKVSKLVKKTGTVAGVGYVTTPSDCTKDGAGYLECTECHEMTKAVTIPAGGHDWSSWDYGTAADCENDMTAARMCYYCDERETKVVANATGHNWVVSSGTDATCTAEGKVTRFCAVCGDKEENKVVPALGHDMTKVVEVVAPTCTADGYTIVTCARGCDVTEKTSATKALGHAYEWVTVTKPSESGAGKDEYTCATCGDVADTKTVKYTKYYHNNTMTSYGPTTKELVGGSDWYRVTPIDTTVDGVYTYDLIASNRYTVGTVTIKVAAGVLTVTYDVNANHIEINDESLLIYASKADLASGIAVTANVGSDINLAETFGADAKIIVSLVLTGDYDAAGNGVSYMIIDDAEIAAMIANID